MALGTAGYTAGLAVELLELNGMAPGAGKVLVNGATGGVATLAIDMLAGLGYTVVAVTGKDGEHEFLRRLGAAEILPRQTIEMGSRPPSLAFPRTKTHVLTPATVQPDWTTNHHNPTEQLRTAMARTRSSEALRLLQRLLEPLLRRYG